MGTGYHPPIEEYLESIHELQEEGTPVIQARLAERVGHAPPSVSEMVKRLEKEGYLTVEGRQLVLTKKGEEKAESVVRKHRLAERLLTDIIGLPWHAAHEEACRWEHVISDQVEERLIVLLDNPTTCPHGNPIPGMGGLFPKMTALTELEVGTTFKLERITEQVEVDEAALTHLGVNEFGPGVVATLTQLSKDSATVTFVDTSAVVEIPHRTASALYVSVN